MRDGNILKDGNCMKEEKDRKRAAAFGENLRKIRSDAGLTQDELAEQVHVTRQSISNWETGKAEPDLCMLEQLSKALKTDLSVLISGDPAKEETGSAAPEELLKKTAEPGEHSVKKLPRKIGKEILFAGIAVLLIITVLILKYRFTDHFSPVYGIVRFAERYPLTMLISVFAGLFLSAYLSGLFQLFLPKPAECVCLSFGILMMLPALIGSLSLIVAIFRSLPSLSSYYANLKNPGVVNGFSLSYMDPVTILCNRFFSGGPEQNQTADIVFRAVFPGIAAILLFAGLKKEKKAEEA